MLEFYASVICMCYLVHDQLVARFHQLELFGSYSSNQSHPQHFVSKSCSICRRYLSRWLQTNKLLTTPLVENKKVMLTDVAL